MTETYVEFMQKYQRDINRIFDADRNTRKRGLQKLLEDLPWNDDAHKLALQEVCKERLLPQLFLLVSDTVEKCRELTLSILKKVLALFSSYSDFAEDIITALCSRVSDVPFLETSEELRLAIAEVLCIVCVHDSTQHILQQSKMTSILFPTIGRALTDSFPAVKRQYADLLVQCKQCDHALRLHFKSISKALVSNCSHQHHKVRSSSIKALGVLLCCIADEYHTAMSEIILPLCHKLTADRSNSPKFQLCHLCRKVIISRIQRNVWMSVDEDKELVVILVLLMGDNNEDVANTAKQDLQTIATEWVNAQAVSTSTSMEIEAGGASTAVLEIPNMASEQDNACRFMQAHASSSLDIIATGIEGWTVDARMRYMRGLSALAAVIQQHVEQYLPRILSSLAGAIRDADVEIRSMADYCCVTVGSVLNVSGVEASMEYLLPRIRGEVQGGDTWQHRTAAIQLLNGLVKGFAKSQLAATEHVHAIVDTLKHPALLEFRDLPLRENLLLFIRTLMDLYAIVTETDRIKYKLVIPLLYLSGRCSFEADVVPAAAIKQLQIWSEHMKLEPASLLSSCYESSLSAILYGDMSLAIHEPSAIEAVRSWTPSSPARAAFEVLVRECPKSSWEHHDVIVSLLVALVQPKANAPQGSAEEIAATYAAQAGITETTGEIDLRLSMLALLEGLVRCGSGEWTCGRHLNAAAEKIIRFCLVPNLVWKAGRVEGVARKVTLTATYSLLRAGGIAVEILYGCAASLVPLLASNSDDYDTTTRQLSCLCLAIVFERLRGGFGDQAVRDLYPKLLKRLDDSVDEIRKVSCGMLKSFLLCAAPECYRGTMIDYTLDQLFVHLDDPDASIQAAVAEVIITAATIDKALVEKKAQSAKLSHRKPTMSIAILEALEKM